MRKLLVIGYGSHGRAVGETALACGWDSVNFADDNNPDAIVKVEQVETIIDRYDSYIVSIGNNSIRKSIYEKLGLAKAAVLIHPSAFVSPSAFFGAGSIILPGAVIHTNASIGKGCIISIGALIDHDDVVDDYSHINAGVIVKAGSNVRGKLDAPDPVFG